MPRWDWAVKGTPVIRRPDWVADSYNFVGCYLSEGSSISIAEYFGTQAAHKTQPLLRLNTAGPLGGSSRDFNGNTRAGRGLLGLLQRRILLRRFAQCWP